jgi:hypothetical protein
MDNSIFNIDDELITEMSNSIRQYNDGQLLKEMIKAAAIDRAVYINNDSYYRYHRTSITNKWELHKFTKDKQGLIRKELANSPEDLELYEKLKKLQNI